ncbi:Asp-tRNA(Asn)/Glu-tRNA(Gln) amidotransferase subunit GatA [Candidatus Beckwithbacteria bacterium]|nr:Asp-tRNA(Asn)/Glu-tRNA(Gln) amidotransferase subunit GatA [Candidatus Beckwithbacteria bacterium]
MQLNQLTLLEALDGLKKKKFTSVELTQACLDQSQKFNDKYNIYLTFNDNAFTQAKQADAEIAKDPKIFERKPLLGIPYALKDNFLTKDLRTTASTKVLDNYIPVYESTVSTRLKNAGAILLGKTNMDAWAHGSSTETSDYGPTINPWGEKRLPGGSSGGSTAAVASDMCIFAIGSETAGSIRQPASWCGVTGLKPSYGRCSRYGVIAMASSTDSPGPIGKTIKDAKYILEIIAGEDEYDGTSIKEKSWHLNSLEIKEKIRVGIVTDYFLKDAEKGVNETVLKAIADLQKNPNLEFTDVSLLDPKYAIAVYTILQRSEVSSNLGRFDGIRYGNDRSFFAKEAKRRMMFGAYSLSSGYYDAYYKKALKARTAIVKDFEKVFTKVDVLISPTSPCLALPLGATQGQAMFGEMQDILVEASSIAGLPGISVSCGFVNQLPVGLQFIGKMKDEAMIIKLAAYYQTITDWHKQKPEIK